MKKVQYYLFSMFTVYFFLEGRFIKKFFFKRYESQTYELSFPVESSTDHLLKRQTLIIFHFHDEVLFFQVPCIYKIALPSKTERLDFKGIGKTSSDYDRLTNSKSHLI